MTLASGDANSQNQLLQTVNPYNSASNNTKIEGDGARSVGIVQNYKKPPGGPATGSSSVAASMSSLPPPPPPVQ